MEAFFVENGHQRNGCLDPAPKRGSGHPSFRYFDTVTFTGALTVVPAAFVNSTV